ncbi:protein lifeguard 1-like [Acyrthosiphon pisum]|uniref:Uncharacterized protein n=1 Tax=Acyrthosiphon pisum TaxID=7029 RepID=A0A8R2NT89_ACYPI|nr:protein lifeguard 1-like [Acyrthosiphon pisum]|eukprot:XP_001948007.1 PREDICTED: protein lifeguard 1-like [Acyrthosiphon pisum]
MSTGQETQNPSGDLGFSDKTIRKDFICKVYSILTCQLMITLIFVAIATLHDETRTYIKTNCWLFFTALVITIGTLIALACCENVRRKSPLNFILLFVFTLSESFLIAVCVSRYYPEQILLALGLTILICFTLTIFAFQTKIDFTVIGGFLLIALIILFVGSIVALFFPGKMMTLIIASACAIIFSIFLICDTQRMVGGNHKYSISPEEYIFAALTLYVDIINIFLYILAIIAASDD